MRKFTGENKSQLIILSGVIISVLIIASSAATVGLVNRTTSIEKTSFLQTEFDKVRDKFGDYLEDNLFGRLDDLKLVKAYVNFSSDLFSYALARHNYYFYADFIEIPQTRGVNDSVVIGLSMYTKKDYIYEKVTYYIG
jgi:hypothetical protein